MSKQEYRLELESKVTGKLINPEQSRLLQDIFDAERQKNQLYYGDAWV